MLCGRILQWAQTYSAFAIFFFSFWISFILQDVQEIDFGLRLDLGHNKHHLVASNELLWLQKCGATISFLEALKILFFREIEIDSNSSYATPENCFLQCGLSLPREDDTSVCCILTGIQTPMIHQRFESVIPNRANIYLFYYHCCYRYILKFSEMSDASMWCESKLIHCTGQK